MNSSTPFSPLHSAVDSVTSDLREKMSRSVANCREMSLAKSKNDGTKPTAVQPRDKVLSPRQLAAARLLVAGKSVVQVAEFLGIDKRTIFRWKHCQKFQAETRCQLDALIGKPKPAPASRPSEPTRIEFVEAYMSKMKAERSRWEMSRFVPNCREMSRAEGRK